jgi:hypothetical protein
MPVDVIVEGKITAEEAMHEVVQTVVDLKTVDTPVLRINCLDERFQGKIVFAQGGYILGGKIDETGEIGYAAVRKLLLVHNGNYAILDPEKQALADLNQNLWIDAEKVISLLPKLPESPDGLLSPNASAATATLSGDQFADAVPTMKRTQEKPTVRGINSKARQFIVENWRFRYAMIVLWAIILLLLTGVIIQYGDRLKPYLQAVIK